MFLAQSLLRREDGNGRASRQNTETSDARLARASSRESHSRLRYYLNETSLFLSTLLLLV